MEACNVQTKVFAYFDISQISVSKVDCVAWNSKLCTMRYNYPLHICCAWWVSILIKDKLAVIQVSQHSHISLDTISPSLSDESLINN